GHRHARVPEHDRRAAAVHRAADPRVLPAGLGLGQLHAVLLHLEHRHRGQPDQPRCRDGRNPRPGHRAHLGVVAHCPERPPRRGAPPRPRTSPPRRGTPPGTRAERRTGMTTARITGTATRPSAAPPESRRERRRRERIAARDDEIPIKLYGLRRGTVTLLTGLAFLFAV